MGAITDSIREELDERHARHPDRPDRELLEHLLVAVQRERIAAVGYDTERLGERLRRAPLPEASRRTIARAIGQIWLDENMHARYVLGVLQHQPELATRLAGAAQSAEGGVGGWMTAVEQHATWGDAPAERLAAALVEVGGRLSGRIPAAVRSSLTYAPIRDWCAFSVDAEESAVISFDRMIALAAEVARMPSPALDLLAGFTEEFTRMRRDEGAHARIFGALAAALGDDDGFVPGATPDGLERTLAAIERDLDLPTFGGARAVGSSHPVGAGGVVVIARGDGPAEKLATFDRALDDAGFDDALARRVAARGKTLAEATVAVKVDLMLAWHRDDPSSHVDPALIEHLAARLLARGFGDVVVCDAQNVYARFYANRDIASVGRYVGLRPAGYRLVDLAAEPEPFTFARAMGVYAVGRAWRDADARVSFAKLKTHPSAVAQLCLRNTGTVIPQTGEHFFSDRLTDFTHLVTAVLHDLPPHFGVIDGYAYAADGLLGVLADPTPKHPGLVVAGEDVLAVDHTALRLMGERDPWRAPDLRAALGCFGDPTERTDVRGDTTPIADWDAADAGVLSAPLAALAEPVYASWSGRGAVFVPDVDPVAFPPIGETAALRATRRLVRAVLGIGSR
jgi:uncharacterized protein (DUF362 family)